MNEDRLMGDPPAPPPPTSTAAPCASARVRSTSTVSTPHTACTVDPDPVQAAQAVQAVHPGAALRASVHAMRSMLESVERRAEGAGAQSAPALTAEELAETERLFARSMQLFTALTTDCRSHSHCTHSSTTHSHSLISTLPSTSLYTLLTSITLQQRDFDASITLDYHLFSKH